MYIIQPDLYDYSNVPIIIAFQFQVKRTSNGKVIAFWPLQNYCSVLHIAVEMQHFAFIYCIGNIAVLRDGMLTHTHTVCTHTHYTLSVPGVKWVYLLNILVILFIIHNMYRYFL